MTGMHSNALNLYGSGAESGCGCMQGYAMVEYATAKEAQDAIDAQNGQEFMTQQLQVTWCFVKGPNKKRAPALRR